MSPGNKLLETRMQIRSEGDLAEIQKNIQIKYKTVSQAYESLKLNDVTTPDIVQKMDAWVVLSAEIWEIVTKRLATINETFNDRREKDRVI